VPTKLRLAHQFALPARTLELVPVDGRVLLEVALRVVVVRAREDPLDLRAPRSRSETQGRRRGPEGPWSFGGREGARVDGGE
jgi:hypothetical protein